MPAESTTQASQVRCVTAFVHFHYKFTGKERDTESGNDYFGARYYANSMGRWMSPDWSAVPVSVPYANLTNPQTLNLYAMVVDNPESFADLDGHGPEDSGAMLQAGKDNSGGNPSADKDSAQNQQDSTTPPPPPTPDPAGTRTDPALNPSNSNSNSSTTNTSADQTQAPMESRGQQPKGERNTTGKPEFKDKGDKLLNDGTNNYTYDAENRIKSVNGTTTYTYDAQGRRVAKTTGSSVTDILYDREGHVLLYNSNPASGSTPFVETYVAGMHLGTYYLNSTVTATIFYYDHSDWLGTERARTNLSGIACETIGSLPFGDEQTISGTCGDISHMHFTGKERDAESSLDYFGARYYASSMGRFMSIDPAFESEILGLPQTWNRYSYVYNRPTFSNDPDGRCPPCIGALVGGVIEGGFDLGKQLYNNGGSLSDVSWREVGANALGGAVTGGLAVATGGTSLVANAVIGDVLAGATANVVGGIVTRTAEGDDADEVLSGTELSQDALAGFVGGAGGHVAEEFVHVPGEPVFKGRNMKEGMRRYNKAVGRRNSAVVKQTALGAAGHASTGSFTKWLEELFFSQQPLREEVKSKVKFIPCGSGSGQQCTPDTPAPHN